MLALVQLLLSVVVVTVSASPSPNIPSPSPCEDLGTCNQTTTAPSAAPDTTTAFDKVQVSYDPDDPDDPGCEGFCNLKVNQYDMTFSEFACDCSAGCATANYDSTCLCL